jgi:bifunctional non-homologous end joining protein LigD
VSAKFVRPCIPTTAKAVPRGDAWLHEPKLDGCRFQFVKDGRQVRLHSKSGSDWTKRLSLLAEALAGIRCKSTVIESELVFPTSDGHPDFRALQAAMAPGRHHQLAVFAFDLLHHDGKDLRSLPLIERRLKLTELVARSSVHCLHLVQGFDNGANLFRAGRTSATTGRCSPNCRNGRRPGQVCRAKVPASAAQNRAACAGRRRELQLPNSQRSFPSRPRSRQRAI